MRIEIMLDNNQKISQSAITAFHGEVTKRVHVLSLKPLCVSAKAVTPVSKCWGSSLKKDKRRLKSVWEDDSWMHLVNFAGVKILILAVAELNNELREALADCVFQV